MVGETFIKGKLFIGYNAGKDLRNDIKKAKHSITIVSPYLTPSYTEDLLKAQRKGIKVSLLTSDGIELDQYGTFSELTHHDIIKQEQRTLKDGENRRDALMQLAKASFGLSILSLLLVSHLFSPRIGITAAVIMGVAAAVFAVIAARTKIYEYSYYLSSKNHSPR